MTPADDPSRRAAEPDTTDADPDAEYAAYLAAFTEPAAAGDLDTPRDLPAPLARARDLLLALRAARRLGLDAEPAPGSPFPPRLVPGGRVGRFSGSSPISNSARARSRCAACALTS